MFTRNAGFFLSYTHKDNDLLDGRIVSFARDLAGQCGFFSGGDIGVFIDRTSINWGEEWRKRLDSEIVELPFLLAAVTPRFLASADCRKEVTDFTTLIDQGEQKLLLPLIWASIEKVKVTDENRTVHQALMDRQYPDVPELYTLMPGTPEYKKVLVGLAQELADIILARSPDIDAG